MKLLYTFFAFIVCLSLSAQKEKGLASSWRSNPSGDPGIDDSQYISYKKGLVKYYISNDDRNIYVDLKITETVEQNRILRMGLTVWVCTDGKSHKDSGIRFPIGSDVSGEHKGEISPPTPFAQANTIQLTGFGNTEPSRFPSDNSDNIRGKVKYDREGNLLYSLVIPFDRFPVPGGKKDEQALLTLGIEYGSLPEFNSPPPGGAPISAGVPAGVSSVRKMGGASTRGSMPRGATPPPSVASAGSQPAPVLFWIKEITLAKND